MRTIIIALIIVLSYFLLKSIIKKNKVDKVDNKKDKNIMKYCDYCQSYVTEDEPCANKDTNHRNL